MRMDKTIAAYPHQKLQNHTFLIRADGKEKLVGKQLELQV